ncbi:MAG: hypothetical protein ABSC48_00200 [Terracidiphilus sp.]
MNTDYLDRLSEAEWKTMASCSGIDPVELQGKMKEALKNCPEPSGPPQVTVTRHGSEEVSAAEDEPREIVIGLGDLCSIKLAVSAQIRSIKDFKILVKYTFMLLGFPVLGEEIKFDQDRLEHSMPVEVPGIAGSITVGWRFKENHKWVCSIFGARLKILWLDPLEVKTDLICLPVP